MKVKISPVELRLLESQSETKDLVAPLVIREPSLALEGSGYLLAQLREACGDVLNRIGFDENYNPNADGQMLEDLIDQLFEG
jgi:hypothetical protein